MKKANLKIGMSIAALLVASGVAQAKSVSIAGQLLLTPQTTPPIYQIIPPNKLPADLPNPALAAGELYALPTTTPGNQDQPTSIKPQVPNCTGYYTNDYVYNWPSVAQSQSWWAAQPGAPAVGTYAHTVGMSWTHQDAEGWILSGGCVYQKPKCTLTGGPGVNNDYTWGGQFSAGWIGTTCTYTAEPSCTAPTQPGYTVTSNIAWVAVTPTTGYWGGSCTPVYHQPPSCQNGQIGGVDTWNGTAWVLTGCYTPQPPPPVTNPTPPPTPTPTPAPTPAPTPTPTPAPTLTYYIYFVSGNNARNSGNGHDYIVSKSQFDQVVGSGYFHIDFADPNHNIANSSEPGFAYPMACHTSITYNGRGASIYCP